jgi:hypothetical protein
VDLQSKGLTRGRDAALHGTRAAAVPRAYVKFSLPPIEAARTGTSSGPSPHDVSLAMDAVTSALARGEITPGEAETIAGVVDTFVRAIETTKKDGSRFNLLQILSAGDDDEENSEDDSDSGDYEEAGEYEETDDCDS